MVEGKKKSAWTRAVVHSSAGWMVLAHLMIGFNDTLLEGLFISFLVGYFGLVEFFRLYLTNNSEQIAVRWPRFIAWYKGTWLPFFLKNGVLRESEMHTLTASAWYWLGLAAVYFLFPLEVAAPAILILAFGDPAARIVGVSIGRPLRLLGGKSIAGCLGFLLAACVALVAAILVADQGGWFVLPRREEAYFYAMLVAMVAELYGGKYDNLLIPLSAAATLTLMP